MGLFGNKNKEEVTAKITDFFSIEDMSKINDLVGPKKARNMYKAQYTEIVDCLLDAINNAEKAIGKKEVTKILYSVGAMTKMEPSLTPILGPAIEKMRAFRK